MTTFDCLKRRDRLGTGITVGDDFVAVRDDLPPRKGIIVMRVASGNDDLVVAPDTPARAHRMVHWLTDGTLREHRINRRTAVVRTAGTVATAES